MSNHTKRRGIALTVFLVGVNILAWIWAFCVFHHHAVMLSAALLAYSFGLRHAVDADHIAAIDTVTRKLMQQGKTPLGVGAFFFIRSFDHCRSGMSGDCCDIDGISRSY